MSPSCSTAPGVSHSIVMAFSACCTRSYQHSDRGPWVVNTYYICNTRPQGHNVAQEHTHVAYPLRK
eukprot:46306-Eustigmatos_ZCMA.PRE.1